MPWRYVAGDPCSKITPPISMALKRSTRDYRSMRTSSHNWAYLIENMNTFFHSARNEKPTTGMVLNYCRIFFIGNEIEFFEYDIGRVP